jgi:serine/threonine protein kinase
VIGTKIGFYEITKQLGQGGMGAVYLAEHARIGNRKVVKVLLPEYSQNEQVVRRFENEARAAARLHHRNIITIDDFGLLPSGQWYILMPFLEGSSLEDFLTSHGKLSIHETLHILAQICAALHAAHCAGIVHRDLKPANIFLTQAGDNARLAMLLDFGIAKIHGVTDGPNTQTGAVFGTPLYMAAEQFEDASRADARSDLFALGVIAYQMVTGTLPFGTAAGAILYNKQVMSRPARPTGIPFEWAEILLRTLAVRPQDRPASAREFAMALASATPEQPPFEPSGAAILVAVARELVSHALVDETTVKNNASADRPSPMMWGSAGDGVAPAPATPGILAALAHRTEPAKLLSARAAKAEAQPAAQLTTFSAVAGHRDPVPAHKPVWRRRVAAAALLIAVAVAGVQVLRDEPAEQRATVGAQSPAAATPSHASPQVPADTALRGPPAPDDLAQPAGSPRLLNLEDVADGK